MNTTIHNDLKVKHINDNLNYAVQMLQQISYVGLVIVGAFIVMTGDLTTGGLIASPHSWWAHFGTYYGNTAAINAIFTRQSSTSQP